MYMNAWMYTDTCVVHDFSRIMQTIRGHNYTQSMRHNLRATAQQGLHASYMLRCERLFYSVFFSSSSPTLHSDVQAVVQDLPFKIDNTLHPNDPTKSSTLFCVDTFSSGFQVTYSCLNTPYALDYHSFGIVGLLIVPHGCLIVHIP